ncbi:GNAT family N-acetyltransferase [Kitasatospora sp. McL0602]|uniref:GNAT family N-acetyltransferase n=1 Tax=Kitasatospora sp. McL0602 TaxID=3439530 RepID=UPI003F88B04F
MSHLVILNTEQQYAVWPQSAALPAGWQPTGWTGDEKSCLDRIGQEWTDLRPASVRAAVAEDRARPAVLLIPAGTVQLREVLPEEAAQLKAGSTAGLDWLGGEPGEGTRAAAGMLVGAAAAGLHQPGWGMYLLTRAEDAVVVGGMGFHGGPQDGQAEIGFDLVEPARGHGYATQALGALARWALTQPGVDRVIATTDPDNLPSQRVMERAGFTRMPDADGLFVYQLAN